MPQFTQIEGAGPEDTDCRAELADLTAHRWDGLEFCIMPEFHPRMFAWSLGLSSILWYSLITAGLQVWKVWH